MKERNTYELSIISNCSKKSMTFTNIPDNCYVDDINSLNATKYEILFNKHKISDVYGIIRYNKPTNTKIKKNINDWQKIIGD